MTTRQEATYFNPSPPALQRQESASQAQRPPSLTHLEQAVVGLGPLSQALLSLEGLDLSQGKVEAVVAGEVDHFGFPVTPELHALHAHVPHPPAELRARRHVRRLTQVYVVPADLVRVPKGQRREVSAEALRKRRPRSMDPAQGSRRTHQMAIGSQDEVGLYIVHPEVDG